LSLLNTREGTVDSIVQGFVDGAALNYDVAVQSNVLEERAGVMVRLTANINSPFGKLFNTDYSPSVQATARIAGGTPFCLLSLNETEPKALYLGKKRAHQRVGLQRRFELKQC
jgi:hypothetical protein